MKSEILPISITMADNHVVIMYFVVRECKPDGSIRYEKEPTKENIEAEVQKVFGQDDNKPIRWRKITTDEIPIDRTYRNAWIDDGKVISHDMDKVRDIHLTELKIERVSLLEQKDKKWMRAMGQKNTVEADRIEAERQALRDMPTILKPLLDEAKTIEEIKKIKLVG